MNKEEYQEYLISSHWKTIRERKLKSSNYRCERCGSPYMLQVHHLTYGNLQSENDKDLKVLCDYCHKTVHGIPTGNQRPIIPKHIRDEQLRGMFYDPKLKNRLKTQKLQKASDEKKQLNGTFYKPKSKKHQQHLLRVAAAQAKKRRKKEKRRLERKKQFLVKNPSKSMRTTAERVSFEI